MIETRYYEMETMSPELREAISITFDRNMTILGPTFKLRSTWIFNDDIKTQVRALYQRRYNTTVVYNGKFYDWIIGGNSKVPKLVVLDANYQIPEDNPFLQ